MASPAGLASVLQSDFSGGMWQGTQRALIPQNGAYDLVNVLLNDDGSAYRRGGTGAQSNAPFGAGLRPLLWDGVLVPGQRTLFASGAAFGTLAADDATPVSLGGAGVPGPVRANELADLLFVDGGAIWGGSRKAADYSAGTVGVTNGSVAVTGAGTVWGANVDAGMLLRVAGAGRYYTVASVGSDTALTLTEPYEGTTATGQSYGLTRLGTTSVSPYRGTVFAVAGNRLLSFEGDKVWESDVLRPHSFPVDNFLELAGGASILGGERVGDALLIFATNGIWGAYNLSFEITDQAGNPQQRLQQVNGDVILWGRAGVWSWSGTLIVPALDHVYLVSPTTAPVPLTESIKGLYQSYVKAGYVPGQAATFLSHYLLPIVDGANVVQDVLVCRLDRPQRTREGVAYPWTHMADTGGKVCAFAVRGSARPPRLLGSSSLPDAKVVRADTWWAPDGGVKNDHDGTTHHVEIVSRDQEPGNLVTWRRLNERHEGTDAGADSPTLQASYSTGTPVSTVGAVWDAGLWDVSTWATDESDWIALQTQAGPSDGRDPYGWTFGAHGRLLRWRLVSTAPWASLTIRETRLSFRPSPKP